MAVTAGVVVSICGPLWVRPESDRLAALPALSAMVTPVGRLSAVAASEAAFWPAATVVLKTSALVPDPLA